MSINKWPQVYLWVKHHIIAMKTMMMTTTLHQLYHLEIYQLLVCFTIQEKWIQLAISNKKNKRQRQRKEQDVRKYNNVYLRRDSMLFLKVYRRTLNVHNNITENQKKYGHTNIQKWNGLYLLLILSIYMAQNNHHFFQYPRQQRDNTRYSQ